MKQVFIETGNVTALSRALTVLEDTHRGDPGICLVRGRAGRGKTAAAMNHHAIHGGLFLRAWEDWTQQAFLQALCFEVKGTRPHGCDRCKREIMEALSLERRTIIIDEADRLKPGRLEDLRDIHDVGGAPVVLIGEEGLYPMISARRRTWSRVTQDVEFLPINQEDILLYASLAAGLTVSPEAAGIIRKQTDGDFRLVHNTVRFLEQAARARQSRDVDGDMIRGLKIKTRGW